MKDPLSLCHLYLDAKRSIIEAGFGAEVDWQARLSTDEISEQQFLREYTWVVFNSGFRERTIRRLFPLLEKAFLHWENAVEIWKHRRSCRQSALRVFGNKRKVN